MGQIQDAFALAFRDYETSGVPASGDHEPDKAEIQAIGAIVERELGAVAAGIARYETVALMNADTGKPAGTLAYVYANAGSVTDAANKFYQWNGAAWVVATWFATAITAALDAKLTQTRSLLDSHWLDTGVLDGRLAVGTGWTAGKEALARAIKFVRLTGADPADQYFIGIFTNNAGADNVIIYRASDSTIVCAYSGVVTKSTTGLTRVACAGAVVSADLYIDYREITAYAGNIQNSNAPGPLWIARETADTFIDRRLLAVENAALLLRNESINGGFDPDGAPIMVNGVIPNGIVPYKAPNAALAGRGIDRSISIGPEAADLLFFYKTEPLIGTVASQYFFASHYLYASNPADFPLQILAFSMVNGNILGGISTSGGYVQISTNVRLYWTAGQFQNNSAINGVTFGPGAKLAAAAEVAGFTFRRSPTPIVRADVRADDWDGYVVSERALGATARQVADLVDYPARMTPYVAAGGELRGRTDAADVLLAENVGTIRGVVQTGPMVRWVDDGLTARRQFSADPFDAIAGLGVTKIVFKPMLGQSLTVGTGGYPIITTESPRPGRAFMFNGGTRVTQGNTFDNLSLREIDDAQLLRLVPLFESLPPNGLNFGETQGGGEAWVLGAPGGMGATEVMAFASFGFGGITVAQLSKGTLPYANLIRGVERLHAWCALNGITLEIPAVDYDQGEANYSTAANTYTTALLALQADLQTDIRAILGTPAAVIPLLIRQPSSWTNNSPGYQMAESPAMLAVVDAAIANPARLKLAGPQYPGTNYTDGVHMGAPGYRREGEYLGAATRDLRAGGSTKALYATAVANAGTTVTITFNATSQIAIDTALVSDPGQNGLRLIGPDGVTTIALSAIATSGMDKITATAAAPLVAGQTYTVGIADVGVINQPAGATTGPRSNIRDSSAQPASTGPNLYNWAHSQRKSFVAS